MVIAFLRFFYQLFFSLLGWYILVRTYGTYGTYPDPGTGYRYISFVHICLDRVPGTRSEITTPTRNHHPFQLQGGSLGRHGSHGCGEWLEPRRLRSLRRSPEHERSGAAPPPMRTAVGFRRRPQMATWTQLRHRTPLNITSPTRQASYTPKYRLAARHAVPSP